MSEIPAWTPSRSTMGNIENTAIYTVAVLTGEDALTRRNALRDLYALFRKLRKEHEQLVLKEDWIDDLGLGGFDGLPGAD